MCSDSNHQHDDDDLSCITLDVHHEMFPQISETKVKYCLNAGFLCRNIGLLCGNIGLFCGNAGLSR